MSTGIPAQRSAEQHEQLLKLYWNRAEVKRELSDLRQERDELLEKVRDQERGITRAREQLEGLERVLTIPHAAANAMVYFQLRHLWKVAGQRIERCATDFELQRRQRELRQLHDTELAKRQRRLDAIAEKLATLVGKQEGLADDARRLAERFKRWGVIRRWVRGPQIRRQLARLNKGQPVLGVRIDDLRELMQKIEGERLPELLELSTGSRRLVNAAVVAVAQFMAIHFSDHNLARLAKESMECSVGTMEFGDRRECDRMVAVIRERLQALQQHKASAVIAKRVERLVPLLAYGNETDTVPLANSVSSIDVIDGKGSVKQSLAINVLADNLWGLRDCMR